MTPSAIPLGQIDAFIRTQGQVAFTFAGRTISFDLRHRHERAYAAKLLFNLAYPQSDIDSMLFKRFVRPGDTVLDAGANIGFTALEFLDAGASKVVAVEAVPDIYGRLEQLAGDGIITVGKALSSAPGLAEITISTSHNQGSSLKAEIAEMFPGVFGDQPSKAEVTVTTIDELVRQFGNFDLWKLDIEGAEVDALHGARKALNTSPPRVILTELYGDFKQQFQEVISASHPFAYRAFIRVADYSLVLTDHATSQSDDFHATSPTFVFSTEEIPL